MVNEKAMGLTIGQRRQLSRLQKIIYSAVIASKKLHKSITADWERISVEKRLYVETEDLEDFMDDIELCTKELKEVYQNLRDKIERISG